MERHFGQTAFFRPAKRRNFATSPQMLQVAGGTSAFSLFFFLFFPSLSPLAFADLSPFFFFFFFFAARDLASPSLALHECQPDTTPPPSTKATTAINTSRLNLDCAIGSRGC